jgi:phosphatidylserine decarboxylase
MTADSKHPSLEQDQGFARHLLELTRETVPPMHPAGRPFVLAGALITLLLRRIASPLGVLGALLTGWCAFFFREPKRVPPSRPGVLVAPADGLIASVEKAAPPAELGLGDVPVQRVSVFLSIFDVHVQRIPADGEVRSVVYRPGKFLSADLDKASEENERNAVLLRLAGGQDVAVVQIAGLVARRIVCSLAEGDRVRTGETYGLIRFGSRVDTYFPADARVLVEPGQRAVGGETVYAEFGTSSAGAHSSGAHS